MAIQLFGFEIGRAKKQQDEEENKTFALPQNDDGAVVIQSGAYYGTYVDLDGVVRNEIELITRYREMSMQPELETAIDEIVNESIVNNDNGQAVEINSDDLKQPESIKRRIQEEFDFILKLLNFGNMGHDIFRRWYIDGRIFYHVVIDEKSPSKGIKELRYIDPRRIRKIREIQKTKDTSTGMEIIKKQNEYYLYNERGVIGAHSNLGTKIATDSIVNVNSGLMDSKRTMVMSYLHKAIKPLNQLRMVEDATVIYRLSRAPERRVFYVDVGNMPTIKAEQYLRDIMVKYRNKLVYDSSTGEIKDDRKHLCLDMNTKVPLLDGRTLTLTEISQEYKNKPLWVYSCDPLTGKFAPGLITWAGISRPNAEIMRITLDNGKTIECTPDHKFPVWNKGLTQAKDLVENDSLIPLYRRLEGITPGAKKNKDYEQIWLNDDKKWSFTHKEVSNWKDKFGLNNEFVFYEEFKSSDKKTVHHKNINRFDNSPDNLTRMNSKDHILYHRHSSSNSGKIGGKNCYEAGLGVHNKNHPDYREWHVKAGKIGGRVSSITGKSQENFAKGRQVLSNLLEDSEYREQFVDKLKKGWTQEKKIVASDHAKRNELSKRGNDAKKELYKTEAQKEKHRRLYMVEYPDNIFDIVEKCIINRLTVDQTIDVLNNSNMLDTWQILNKNKSISPNQKVFDKFNKQDLCKITKKHRGKTFGQLKQEATYRNHKVVKIEYLNECRDTGCLTIDGNETYHNYHTFALDAGVYTQNSMLEDFWLPRREGCFSLNTKIKLLDGRDVELGQLIVEHKLGKQNWVYSVSPEGTIVPGKITWAGVTRNDAKVIDIHLDNGEIITATPDHNFILRNGEKIEAQNLQIGTSLMPLYIRNKDITHNRNGKYLQIQDNKTNKWIFSHRMVSEYIYGKRNLNEVVHHIDFTRVNNNPENLVYMDKKEHIEYHAKMGTNSWKNGDVEEHKKNLSISGKKFFQTEEGIKRRKEISEHNKTCEKIWQGFAKGREKVKQQREIDKKLLSKEEYLKKWSKGLTIEASKKGAQVWKETIQKDRGNLSEEEFATKYVIPKRIATKAVYAKKIADIDLSVIENIIRDVVSLNKNVANKTIVDEIKKTYPSLSLKKLRFFLSHNGYNSVTEFIDRRIGNNFVSEKRKVSLNKKSNHTVSKIVWRTDTMDVGTLTIDENHEYHDYHNFALSSGIFVMNSRGTEITTLPGGMNLGELEDVKYFERKLYKSLGVPSSRLESQQGFSLGRTTEITRDELKFSKFIQRLRNKFSTLFDDLLRVQLVLKKICTEEEWKTFKEDIFYDFIKDNNFTELKEAELLTTRLQLLQAVDPYVGRYYSMEWVRKNVLQQTEDDIEEINNQISNEQSSMAPQSDDSGGAMQQLPPNMPPPTPVEQMQNQQSANQNGLYKDQADPLIDQRKMRFVNDTLEVA